MADSSSSANQPDAFDPYHKWLGIPAKEQPPHHYRLLGVNIFESDSDVIEAAANRQSTFLRQYATGPHGEHSQKLLNAVSEAQICLLVPEQKEKYDKALREKLAALKAKTQQAKSPSIELKPEPTRQPSKPDSIFKDDDDDAGGTYAVSSKGAKKPKAVKQAKEEMMSDADIQSFHRLSQQCIEKHDYSQAVELLEGIPRSQRSTPIQKLYEKAVRLNQKCEELNDEMNDAYSLQDYPAAFSAAKQLLKLKPGHRGAKDIAREISQGGLLKSRQRQQPRPRKQGGIPPIAIKLAVASLVIGGVVWGGMALMNGMKDNGLDEIEQVAEVGTVRFQVDDAFRKANLTILIDDTPYALAELEKGVEFKVGSHPLEVKDGKRTVRKDNIAVDPNNVPVVTLTYQNGKVDGTAIVDLDNDTLKLPDGPAGELHVLQGHTNDIRDLTFSPNGRYLASAASDRTARLWNVETGAEIRAIKPGNSPTAVSFSPDSKWIATNGGRTTGFQVWDLSTGLPLKNFEGHKALVTSLVYSPDGKSIASASSYPPDGSVRLWDAVTGVEKWQYAVHHQSARSISFSPGGKQLLAVVDSIVMTLDVETGERLRLFDGDGPARFSADGSVILTKSATQKPQLWNAYTGVELRTLPDVTYLSAMEFSSTGPIAALTTNNRNDTAITLVNTVSGEKLTALEGHKNTIFHLAFTPDGRFLASGGRDKTIRIWRLPNEAVDPAVKFESIAKTVEPLPDGPVGEVRTFEGAGTHRDVSRDGRFAVTTQGGFAKVWNINTGELVFKSLRHDAGDAAISDDGTYLFTAGKLHLYVWDIATGRELQRFPVPGTSIDGISMSSDCRRLLATVMLDKARDSKVGVMFDVIEGRELRRFPANGRIGIRQAAITADGQHVVTLDLSGKSAQIFDAATGAKKHRLSLVEKDDARVLGNVNMRLSPEGSRMAVSGTDTITRLFNVASGERVNSIPIPSNIYGLDLAPGAAFLLTCGTEVQLYDESSNRLVKLFEQDAQQMRSIHFVPGGDYAISSGSDETMRIWRLPEIEWPNGTDSVASTSLDFSSTAQEVRTFQAHEGRGVSQLVFAPSGNAVVSISSNDTNVRLWNTTTASELKSFKTDNSGVGAAGYARNGESLITGQTSGSIIDWNVATGNKTIWSKSPGKPIRDMAVSPDGKLLVTSSSQDSAALRMWDIELGEQKWQYQPSVEAAMSLAFSPDGSLLLAEIDNVVTLLNANDGQRLRIFAGDGPVAFSPDGNSVVTSSQDALHMWSFDNGREVRRFRGFNGDMASIAFSPDGSKLAAVQQRSSEVHIFDVPSGVRIAHHCFDGNGEVSAVAFAPNQPLVAFGTNRGLVGLWQLKETPTPAGDSTPHVGTPGTIARNAADDPQTGELGRISLPAYYPSAPVVSADGRFVGLIHNYAAKVWNMETGEFVFKSSADRNRPEGIALSQDASVILIRTSAGVDRWELATGNRHICVDLPNSQGLAVSPDGKTAVIFSGGRNGKQLTTALYEVMSGNKLATLAINAPGRTPRAEFSADGSRVAIVDGNSIKLFDGASGAAGRVLSGPRRGFRGRPVFSVDGNLLYALGSERTIESWSLSDGKHSRSTDVRRYNVIAVGPNATFLAYTPAGLTLHKTSSGDEVANFDLPYGPNLNILYTPDGEYAVSTSSDNTIRTWKLPTRRGGAGK